MKTPTLLAIALLALAVIAHAVPTEINYQGVLTDQNGNPVNGVRAMQIKIYDAPTGGTLLYSEDLGNVPVQDGIYSFSFGANGTSNALTTEIVATANGTSTTYQKVLSAPSVVAGSVVVTDGTYTWDQANGSSNENEFGVSYSSNLRRVTVTYYNGAPAGGVKISAQYKTPISGISGALGGENQIWAEVSLNGVVQNPRQAILTVPFAVYARNVSDENIASANDLDLLTKAVAQTNGIEFKTITGRHNSIGDILGVVSQNGQATNEENARILLPSGGTLINTVAVGLGQNWETIRDGTIRYNYADGSNHTINWDNSSNRSQSITIYCANPFPAKKVVSIGVTGQEINNSTGRYQTYRVTASAFTDQFASLIFDGGNTSALKVFVSPQADHSKLNSAQIRIVLGNSESVWGDWNKWIDLPSGSTISRIEVSGRLKDPIFLTVPSLRAIFLKQ